MLPVPVAACRVSARPARRRGSGAATFPTRDRRISDQEEQQLFDTCKRLNDLPRGNAKLTWDVVQKVRARAQIDVPQRELALAFNISQSRCSEIMSGAILGSGLEAHDRRRNT
jgi:hypothetical protein